MQCETGGIAAWYGESVRCAELPERGSSEAIREAWSGAPKKNPFAGILAEWDWLGLRLF